MQPHESTADNPESSSKVDHTLSTSCMVIDSELVVCGFPMGKLLQELPSLDDSGLG